MSSPEDCGFCEEIAGSNQRLLVVSDLAVVLLSNPRLLPGHSLVMPKRHVEKPWELTAKERLEIFSHIDNLTRKVLQTGLGQGVDIRQNFRPFLPQSRLKVDHVHFHVLPRENEDELYQTSMRFEKDLFTVLTEEERQKISNALGNL